MKTIDQQAEAFLNDVKFTDDPMLLNAVEIIEYLIDEKRNNLEMIKDALLEIEKELLGTSS